MILFTISTALAADFTSLVVSVLDGATIDGLYTLR